MNNWIQFKTKISNYQIAEDITSIMSSDGKTVSLMIPISSKRNAGLDNLVQIKKIIFDNSGIEFIDSNEEMTGWVQDYIKVPYSEKGTSVISIDHGSEVPLPDGSFKLAPIQNFSYSVSNSLSQVTQAPWGFWHAGSAADIDNDGNIELFAVKMNNPSIISAFELNSLGSITAQSDLNINYFDNVDYAPPAVISFINANNDNYADLFIGPGSTSWSTRVLNQSGLILIGSSEGFDFSNRVELAIPTLHHQMNSKYIFYDKVRTSDINNDGRDDLLIVFADEKYRQLQILLSSESGYVDGTSALMPNGFEWPKGSFKAENWADSAEFIDVNNDGLLDIVLNEGFLYTSEIKNFVFIQKNEGGFRNATDIDIRLDSRLPSDFEVNKLIAFWRFRDLNLDGSTDLILQNNEWENGLPSWSNFYLNINDISSRVINTLTSLSYIDYGTNQNDSFHAGLSGHQLYLYEGNDSVILNSTNYFVDGGGGVDTATFSVNSSDISINKVGAALLINSGEVEIADLLHVERLIFSDVGLAIDTEGTAGQAYRIYEAVLGRAPDLKGLGYWINDMDNGVSLTTIAAGFIGSDEFKTKYGANPSYETYINLLYQNILGRAPDAEGLNYWVSNMQKGIDSPAAVLASFSEGFENTANVAPDIADGIYYTPWIT